MLTTAEISAGTTRLTGNRLKVSDQETLLSVFRLYLKSAASNFPDIAARLSAVSDTMEVKTASKLAAVLTLIEENGFAVGELSGGRSGLKFKQQDQTSLQIRFALTLLGYDLPEDFSGGLGSSGSSDFDNGGNYTGSVGIDFLW